jgi:hypothetical protein
MEILGGFNLIVQSPHHAVGNIIERESYRGYEFVVIHVLFDILRGIVGPETETMDVFGVADIHGIQGAVDQGRVHIDLQMRGFVFGVVVIGDTVWRGTMGFVGPEDFALVFGDLAYRIGGDVFESVVLAFETSFGSDFGVVETGPHVFANIDGGGNGVCGGVAPEDEREIADVLDEGFSGYDGTG